MKVLLGMFIGVLAVLLVLVLVAGYFGFVPGVSSLFGSDKSRDLGVTYTSADYQSARQKGNIQRVNLPSNTPPEQSLKFSGQHAANINLTDNEVTALINEKSWRYFPVHDAQVRFNADGTGEFSGILELDTLKDYAKARGYSEEDFKVVTDWVSRFAVVQNVGVGVVGRPGGVAMFWIDVVDVGLEADVQLVAQFLDARIGFLPGDFTHRGEEILGKPRQFDGVHGFGRHRREEGGGLG